MARLHEWRRGERPPRGDRDRGGGRVELWSSSGRRRSYRIVSVIFDYVPGLISGTSASSPHVSGSCDTSVERYSATSSGGNFPASVEAAERSLSDSGLTAVSSLISPSS